MTTRIILFIALALIFFSASSAKAATGQDSSGVCVDVANWYNQLPHQSIVVPMGLIDIYNNGKAVNVDVIAQGNHGGYSLAIGKDKNGNPKKASDYDPNGLWKLDNIKIIRFKNRYYVVAEQEFGPIDVTDLGKGNICRFHWVWTPVIEEDRDYELCKRAVAGEEFVKIPIGNAYSRPRIIASESAKQSGFDKSIVEPDKNINEGPEDQDVEILDYGSMHLHRAAFMSLEGYKKRLSIGDIYEMLPGGYTTSMLTLLDKGEPSSDQENTSLLQAEHDFNKNDLQGASIYPIRVGDRNLIEADHQGSNAQSIPPRELWHFSQGHIETLCRISEKIIYKPAPAYSFTDDYFTLSVGHQKEVLEKENLKQKSLQQ